MREVEEDLIQAALELEGFLSKNVGENIEWPVQITMQETKDAETLATLLTKLSWSCERYRRAS